MPTHPHVKDKGGNYEKENKIKIRKVQQIMLQLQQKHLWLYRVSQNLCHKLFLGIPHPHLSKKVPINMGPKVNRFRDINCCVEIREMLWLTFRNRASYI
jgi:hypothetical protein